MAYLFEKLPQQRLIKLTVLASCLAGSAAFPAWADGAAVLNSWSRAADEPVKVSFGSMNQSDGAVTATDFELRIELGQIAKAVAESLGQAMPEPDQHNEVYYNFKFPKVTFSNLRDEGGRYALDALDAAQMIVEIGLDLPEAAGGRQLNSIDYNGVSATNLNWAKMPEFKANPAKPVSQFAPMLQAILDFSFDNVTMQSGQSTLTISDHDGEFTQSYGMVRMDNAVSGDIASITGGPISMTLPIEPSGGNKSESGQAKPNGTMTMDIASFSASDYNYGTMLRTLLASGGAVSNDYRTMLGDMAITDWKINLPQEDVDIGIGKFAMSGLGVKTPEGNWLSELDALAAKALADEDLGMSDEELALLPLEIYSVFALDKFEITDVNVRAPEITRGLLGAYGMTGLSSDGMDSLYVKGVDFAGEKGEVVKYEEFSISGVKFPRLDALVAFEKNVANKNIDEVLKAIPIVGSIINSGIELNIPDEDLQFALGRSEVSFADHIGPVPTKITIDVDDIFIPTEIMDREPRQVLAGMGFDALEASYDFRLSWDETTNDLTSSTDIELADGGKLSGRAVLGSIPKIVFERPDESAVFSLLATTFKSLNVRYDDNSLVERGLNLAAQENNTDVPTLKAQIMGLIPVGLAQLNDAELVGKVSQAVGNVLENGSSLSITALAQTPLPLVALGSMAQSNPASLLKSIQVDVTNP